MSATALSARAVQAGFVAALLALWLYVGHAGMVSPIFLPRLERVLEQFASIIWTGRVIEHLRVTLLELGVAYAGSAILGLGLGYAIGRSRYAVAVMEPLIAGIFAVPIIIFLPLFILFFGIDVESKMAFGATYAFFPIVLNTIGGVSQVDARYINVARSLGASGRQMFWRVVLPSALPVIMTGIRIGFIIGFLAIIGSETIAGINGLGSQIVRLAEGMNTAEMFAYVFFVILIALLLNGALSLLQKRINRASEAA